MIVATSVPRWVATSNTSPVCGSTQPKACRPSSRCAELETGRNSVMPWTTPRIAAMSSGDTRPEDRYRALTLRAEAFLAPPVRDVPVRDVPGDDDADDPTAAAGGAAAPVPARLIMIAIAAAMK